MNKMVRLIILNAEDNDIYLFKMGKEGKKVYSADMPPGRGPKLLL
jgi:hypothetical protein